MSTFAALKNLGSAIVSDIAAGARATASATSSAYESVSAKVAHKRGERQIINEFRSMLNEHPGELLAAMRSIQDQLAQPAKPARKPRARKAAAQ